MSEHTMDERIRLKAYQFWLDEGRPEGRDDYHWNMARREIALEDASLSALMPSADSKDPTEPRHAVPKGAKAL